MAVAASSVGWTRPHRDPAFLAGVALLLLFAFAMSWIGVWLGLSVPTVEVAQQVAFMFIFPLTFVSNVFVPLADACPTWLQPVAEWNPISTLTARCATLWGNPNPYVTGERSPSEQPVLVTLIWVVVILAIFAPLGVRRYRNMSR